MTSRDVLHFPDEFRSFLEPYLPPPARAPGASSQQPPPAARSSPLPHVTLTFAQSLDASIAAAPGLQTALSGPESKAMTHYLRSRHDAIIVGVGTALADDPSLNCRLEGVGGYGGEGLKCQPRPVIFDPRSRWVARAESSKLFSLAKGGRGRAPWVIGAWSEEASMVRRGLQLNGLLEGVGGQVLAVEPRGHKWLHEGEALHWEDVLKKLSANGIESVMVEGGQRLIHDLLRPENQALLDSVIITIAPLWLGQGGLAVSPTREEHDLGKPSLLAGRLCDARWQQIGADVAMCGRFHD